MAKKQKQRKQRAVAQRSKPRSVSKKMAVGFEAALQPVKRERWLEALDAFQKLNQQFPDRPEVLTELVNICYELQDMHLYLVYIQQLARIDSSPDVKVSLAGAYMMNGYLLLAYHLYGQFLNQYPSHERSEDALEAKTILHPEVERIVADLDFAGPDIFELAAEHDRVRAYLEQGNFRESRQAAHRFLKKKPGFAPVLNNLSQVEFMEGRFEAAIATARGVIEHDPDNYQALANLAHYLYLTGENEEARQHAAHLKTITASSMPDLWIKKMEAFTYLGDDQSILETFQQIGNVEDLEPSMRAFMFHLAAVATMRQGEEMQAKEYWQQALKHVPDFSLARENLADLALPGGERHGPWPFEFRRWVSQQAHEDIGRMITATQRNSETALERAARRYLHQHPEMTVVVPNLLERGDAPGREFALLLSSTTDSPELLAALKDFALSQHGPDALRHRALQTVSEAGLIPPGSVQMWLKGEWQEIIMMNFEIYQESIDRDLPEAVLDLLQAGCDALYDEQLKEAERIFKQALEIVPNDPTVLNNLAMAYDRMGRKAEARAMIPRIHEAHPDYFFGIIAMANLHIGKDEIEQAEALLLPLMSHERLHISEFRALCMAFIQLYLKKDMPEAAQSWLKMWADLEPDHPDLEYWELQLRLRQFSFKKGLRRLIGRE